MNYKILIPDRLEAPADIEQTVFGNQSEIILYGANSSEEIPLEVWANCDAVLAWHDIQYTRELIETMQNCKAIVRVGVGYDNVDLIAAKENNIVVSNVPDYGTDDVADHTLAFILSLGRGLSEYQLTAKTGDWSWKAGKDLKRLKGSTIGIIGLGRIGTAVAMRAKSFGMNILFYDPYKEFGYEKSLSIERVDSLSKLANKSDYITIHTPLTNETENMIDENFLNECKIGAILINTARGAIVKLDDLFYAMDNDIISKVGLDVLSVEPPDKKQPLINKWLSNDDDWIGRICITPHSAFYNKDSYFEMRKKAAEEAKRILEGMKPLNKVN